MITVKVDKRRLSKILDSQIADIKQQISFEIMDVSNEMVNSAVSDAPRDQGILVNSITARKTDDLNYEVTCPVDYAPFVEFGTKSKVQIPSGLQEIASQFRGQKSAVKAKDMIFEWCRRKGLPEESWYPVYRSIMVNGIQPRPFFFKQVEPARKALIENIKRLL